MSNQQQERFKKLPKYSFIIGHGGGVQRVVDTCGNWVERHEVAQIVESMADEIEHLNSVILALRGHGLRAVPS